MTGKADKIKSGKNLDFGKYWAETIYRREQGAKDFLFAYVRKKFADDDVVMEGAGTWLGLLEEPNYKLITDNDENSDTFGERIPEVNIVHYQDGHIEKIPIQRGVNYKYTFEATPKNIEQFQKLVGYNRYGTTKFIWCLPNGRDVQCRYADEFWDIGLKEVMKHDLQYKRISKDEPKVSKN